MTPQESPWVFLSKTGRPLSYQTMYSDWARVRAAHAAKTGDKHFLTMDLYDLRHFGATTLLNLLEVGEAAVAWQLGHTGSTGTELVLKLYGHPDQKRYMQQIKDAYKRLDP